MEISHGGRVSIHSCHHGAGSRLHSSVAGLEDRSLPVNGVGHDWSCQFCDERALAVDEVSYGL